MLRRILVAAGLLISPVVSNADTVDKSGMLFCTNQDELGEYFLALAKKNMKWAESLDCVALRGGIEYVILETVGGDDSLKSAKVRVFEPGKSKKSFVGYALIVGPDN